MAKRQQSALPPGPGPVQVFRIGNVSASIFAREIPPQEGRPGRVFHSVVLQKSYVDDQGNRQYTNSFDLYELPAAERVLKMATDLLVQLEADVRQG